MSSLKFGTSGLRGLVSELPDEVCFAYTKAFVDWMKAAHAVAPGSPVLLGYDLRDSSPRIAAACAAAVRACGMVLRNCGAIPTPALALSAQTLSAPAIMVTGSHIPADRNGLKFYAPGGEIDKQDEAGILALVNLRSVEAFLGGTMDVTSDALDAYRQRCLSLLAPNALEGLKIGVYQHSSVARDFMGSILSSLGAQVVPIARSEVFVPVDTEALRPDDIALAASAVREHALDALISTDGDADRPLLADDQGRFFRGDLLGIFTAQFLKADCVVTPVTSTSLVESCGFFANVIRTKVGSPFVIEGMAEAKNAGAKAIVGFEANGGVLLGSSVKNAHMQIEALPTRDAMLPILCVLGMAVRLKEPLSKLSGALPPRFNGSGRLEHVEQATTQGLLKRLENSTERDAYFAEIGMIETQDSIDGARFIFSSGDVIHYRASGNAPELRCYSEASTQEAAERLLDWGLKAAARAVQAV